MSKGLKNISIVALITAITMLSCRRDRNELADTDTSLAQKYSTIEQSNNDLDGLANEIVQNNTTTLKTGESSEMLSQCASVIIHYKTNDSLNAEVDFGGSNCLCNDQKYRKGKVKIVFGKKSKAIVLNTENYFVNNNKIDVNRNLKFILPTYFVITSSSSVTFADSNQTISENSTRTINWTEGNTTIEKEDDVFIVSGNGSGTNYNGNGYQVKITNPIKRTGDCAYIKSGTIEITPDKKLARVIDFGNGVCDNIATISIGNYSKIIALK